MHLPSLNLLLHFIDFVLFFGRSWLVNPHFALATIPHFIVYRWEAYRFFTAPLVNTSILSLLFSFLSFSDTGRRLEQSMGSASFGWTCLIMGLATNTMFCTICVLLGVVFQNASFLLWSSSGLWTILFGLLAAECLLAPRNSQRLLFFAKVPVRWYPVDCRLCTLRYFAPAFTKSLWRQCHVRYTRRLVPTTTATGGGTIRLLLEQSCGGCILT